MQPILLDTSVIVAWLDRCDAHHARCAALLPRLRPPLYTCEAVLVECFFLLRHVPGAAGQALNNVIDGTFRLPFRLEEEAREVQELLDKYRDTPADFADACLIAMANKLGTGDILTLDSDFRHYRWRRNRRFRMLIPLD